ncbi:GNAT family N-acetyltransferase [Microbacterium sp. NPDC055455]
MSTVLFRCDATTQGGIGHLVRTLALAEALADRGGRPIVSGDVTAPLAREMLAGSGIEVLPPASTPQALLQQAEVADAALIHVDHYEGYATLHEQARASRRLLSTATDATFGRRFADVIVDGSPRALEHYDPLYGEADVCLGPDHLALRRGLVRGGEPGGGARTEGVGVLVLMGGTDAAGYGSAVARAAVDVPGVARVGLVGGVEPLDGVTRLPRQPDLARLVAGWDIVITAAGTTVWDLAAVGAPMALIGVAENQRDHYDALIRAGAAVGVGFLPESDGLAMQGVAALAADEDDRREQAARARRLVDGRGAERVVLAWTGALSDHRAASLVLRRAELRDAGRLYAWRNDPVVRRQSRNHDPVPWPGHLAWLNRTIAGDGVRFFVAAWRGAVGTVRLDALAEREWEISVTVAPSHRGRGVGGRIIAQALDIVAGDGGGTVVADLRSSNSASRALFRRSGFAAAPSAGEGWERWVARV